MGTSDPVPPTSISISRNGSNMAIAWSPVLLDIEGNNISNKDVKYKVFACDNLDFEVIETEVIEVDATNYNYPIATNERKYFRISAYIE